MSLSLKANILANQNKKVKSYTTEFLNCQMSVKITLILQYFLQTIQNMLKFRSSKLTKIIGLIV